MSRDSLMLRTADCSRQGWGGGDEGQPRCPQIRPSPWEARAARTPVGRRKDSGGRPRERRAPGLGMRGKRRTPRLPPERGRQPRVPGVRAAERARRAARPAEVDADPALAGREGRRRWEHRGLESASPRAGGPRAESLQSPAAGAPANATGRPSSPDEVRTPDVTLVQPHDERALRPKLDPLKLRYSSQPPCAVIVISSQ